MQKAAYDRLTPEQIEDFEKLPPSMIMHYQGFPDFVICHEVKVFFKVSAEQFLGRVVRIA
jgi:hypothetical protein